MTTNNYLQPSGWYGSHDEELLFARLKQSGCHTECRGAGCAVARLVLLRHATGRAIRSTRTTSRASGRGKSCNCRTTGKSYDQLRQ